MLQRCKSAGSPSLHCGVCARVRTLWPGTDVLGESEAVFTWSPKAATRDLHPSKCQVITTSPCSALPGLWKRAAIARIRPVEAVAKRPKRVGSHASGVMLLVGAKLLLI